MKPFQCAFVREYIADKAFPFYKIIFYNRHVKNKLKEEKQVS